MFIPRSSIRIVSSAALAASFVLVAGCDKGSAPPPSAPHTHEDGDHDHEHEGAGHADGDHHDHGAAVELGSQKSGPFEVRASRDGEVKAGADAPIDAWVTGGTVGAVRFWIGSEDGKGSVKAKAELEKDHWHSHVEVPSPLPEGSKLWIEIESDKGERTVVSFDLKS